MRIALALCMWGMVGCLAESVEPRPIAPNAPSAPNDPAPPHDPEGTTDPQRDPPSGECATFASDVEPIFTTNCAFAGCHSGAGAIEGLRLDAGYAHASLVGVASRQSPLPRVAPGAPDESYLLHKLGPDPASGSRMPLGRPALDATTIAGIGEWIALGAPAGALGRCEGTPTEPAENPVASIEISAVRTTIGVGETIELSSVARDSSGDPIAAAIRWENEREPIAYVDLDGKLLGTAAGNTVVRAVYGDVASEPLQIEVQAAALSPASFENEVVPLLSSRCALSGCHVHDGDEPGDIAFDGEARALYYDLVERPSDALDGMDRVRRFDLEDSFLWLKITRSLPPSGAQMPANGALLSTEEVQVLLRWITSGASCEC